jgi:PQQ-like domain
LLVRPLLNGGTLATRKAKPAVFERAWTFPVHHAVGAFAVDRDTCFVAARNTKLIALSATTGEQRWSAQIKNPHGWLAFDERRVFYLNQHSYLTAFDRQTGRQLWSRELLGTNGWLHAFGDRVVVGGWRGYTDIGAMDANDGHTCWSRSARGAALHSTRVHAESATLVIAEPENKRILLARLSDGTVAREYATAFQNGEMIERPRSTTAASEPAVVQCGEHDFVAISGHNADAHTISVEPSIWSQNLSCSGAVVPFVTAARELSAWHLTENRVLHLGAIRHNRRDLLPFCQVSSNSFVAGTSFGELLYVSPVAGVSVTHKLGKRIATTIANAGTVMVCGTDSGEIVGFAITGHG